MKDSYEELHANKLNNLEEMDKLLDNRCNLPIQNHEDIEKSDQVNKSED